MKVRERFQKRRIVLKPFPVWKLIPNIITITAICFGLSSIRYALDQKWEISVTLILIASILDLIDGKVARYLKATSNFGANLDSLADFVDFGIAPAIVLYLWILNSISMKGVGWSLVLFFTVCMAVRLARFNSDLADKTIPTWKEKFFVGVPAPAGAFLAIMPIVISFDYNYLDFVEPEIIGLYMTVIALLMASRIPTFSIKKLEIRREQGPIVLATVGLFIAIIFIEPWSILPLIAIIYLMLIPFSIYKYKQFQLTSANSE